MEDYIREQIEILIEKDIHVKDKVKELPLWRSNFAFKKMIIFK